MRCNERDLMADVLSPARSTGEHSPSSRCTPKRNVQVGRAETKSCWCARFYASRWLRRKEEEEAAFGLDRG